MPPDRILVLGGTRLGRDLAAALLAAGHDVIVSLAGVTREPARVEGTVHRGGFGGAEGLAAFLRAEGIAVIADATHPFAARISANAHQAAAAAGIRYLRLENPPWQPGPGDRWTPVASTAEAAARLPAGASVFAAVGRKEIGAFFARGDVTGIARMIEPPAQPVPPQWQLLLARPPFAVEAERDLLRVHGITHLVAKNSGSDDSFAKLIAARDSAVSVLLVERPPKPAAPTFSEVSDFVRSLPGTLLP